MSRRGGRGGGRGGRAGGGGGRPPRLDAAQIGAYGKRMRAWFASLSVSERQLALAIEDAELIAMVRGMHALSQETGPLLFCSYVADADPKCFRDLGLAACAYPETVLVADERLCAAVRLCDTREYLDTLSLSSDAVADARACFRLLNAAARGSLMKRACLVEWIRGSWQWQAPAWFRGMGYWTLATFIASKLERALWASFCAHAGIDPRVPGTSVMYWQHNRHGGLRSKAHLVTFWSNLDAAERRRVVGRLGNIVESVLMRDLKDAPETQYFDRLSSLIGLAPQFGASEPRGRRWQRSLASVVAVSSSFSSSSSSSASSSSAALVASRPTSARGNPLAAVSVATASAQKRLPGSRARTTDDDNHEPFVLLNDEQLLRDPQFVDRLFFSPLSRAGTPRDLILRRIGQSVQTAYTARFGIELIGPNKRGDKGAKKRRKAAAAAAPSAAPAAAVSSSSAAAPPSKPIAAAPVQELRPTQLHQQHRLLQRERQRAAQKQHETELEQAGAERVTDAAAVTVDVAAAAAVPAHEASASTACAEEDECDGATTPPPSMTQAMTAIADEALKEIVDSVERQAPPPARSIRRQRSSTSEIERTVSREPAIDADDESPMPLETAAAAATAAAEAAAAAGAAKPSAGGSVRRARRKEQRNSLTNSSSEPAFVIEEPFGAAKSRSLPRATAAIAQSPPRASADDEADLSADKRPRAISLTGARAKTASTSPTKASSALLGDDWAIVQRRRRAASPPPSGAADRERLSRRQTSGSAIGTKKPAAAAVQRPWREAAETADDWSVGARRGRYTWSALSLSKKRSPTEAVPPTPPPATAAASAAAAASGSAVVSPPKTATPPLNRGKPQSFNWPVLTRMRSSGAAAASTNDDWSIGFQSRVAAAAAAAPPALAGASSSGATGHSLPATPRPRGMSSLSLSSQLSPLSAAFVRPRAPSLRSIPGMELIIGAFNCVRISVESSDASLRSLSSSSSSMPATAFQSPPVLSPRASFSAADEWVDFSESESVSSVSGSWQTAEEVLSEYGDAIDESLRPVWMPSHRLHYAHDRHDVQLHVEIEDFVCFIYACFLARLNRQQQMIQRVRSAVARLWAGAHVEVYGSYSTCLSIPSSDLDLVVIMPSGGAASPLLLPTAAAAADAPALRPVTSLIPHAPPAMPPHVVLGAVRQHPDALLSPMRQLADELRARGSVRELKLIESAAIPVIKLKTDAERIPTDITFHFENASVASAHSGIAARELVKDLLGRLPPLSALTLVTKQLLHERRLNETFSGGLGSYCLVLLVAVFLDAANNEHKISSPQLGPRRSVRNRSNSNPAAPDLGGGSVAAADAAFEQRKTLGTLLLNLCDFYGSRFDPKTTGVSWSVARGCGLLFPLCHTAPVVPAPLVLLDPYNELRNIAYNAFNFHMVQALFADVAKALRATDAREPTLLSRVVRLNAKDLD